MWSGKRLDINLASVEDLEGLFGIGRARAEAIVEVRKQCGSFNSVSDLRQVPGFGPGLLEQHLGQLSCDATASTSNGRNSNSSCKSDTRETRSSARLHSTCSSLCEQEHANLSYAEFSGNHVHGSGGDTKLMHSSLKEENSASLAINNRQTQNESSVLTVSCISQSDCIPLPNTHSHSTRSSTTKSANNTPKGIQPQLNFELHESDEEFDDLVGGDSDNNGELNLMDLENEEVGESGESESPFRLRSRLPECVNSDKYMMKRKFEGRVVSAGKKRRSFDIEDSMDLRRRPSSGAIVLSRKPIPSRENPPPDLQGWIETFQKWGNAERLLALDELMESCDPTQVRHVMAIIQPQFQRDFISLLPKELALYVLSFLEPKDLLRAAQTCQAWHILAEDNLLWREKCREENIDENTVFDTKIRRKSPSGFQHSPWKSLYMRQHHIEINWRTGSKKPPKVLKGHDDHVITCLEFCGHRIVSGSDDNTLKVWSAITGKCLRTLVGHTGGVWSSQMQSNVIISGSTDRTLKVWNADTGQCTHTLYGHTSTVRCMHLHENRVVSGSRDATLRMWDIDSGNCLHVLMGHVAAVRCVQYDGHRVISGAYDYMVKVWNPEQEVCLHTLQGHTNRVYSLQFDGTHIVSGSLDTSIRVWDAESGNCLHTLIGHQSLTSGMELKDNILVSGNADSTVKVWDITTGQCLQTLQGTNKHQSAVTCLQFNKKFVITSSDDGTVKIWDLKTGDFVRNLVTLESGGSGGVVWRVRTSNSKLVCAVGSRNGTEETKLLVLEFDIDQNCDNKHGTIKQLLTS